MDYKDYYAVLGVAKTATDEEIKRAYRKLARKHHPDLNPGDKSAETKFKEINEANEVLGDPEKRRKYDELGANWRQYEQQAAAGRPGGFPGGGFGPGSQGGYRTVSPEEMEQMFGGGGEQSPFSDFFSTFFGGSGEPAAPGRRGRSGRARRGQDVEAQAELTLEEAFAGTTRKVALARNGKDHTVEVRIPAGIKDAARIRAAGEGGRASGQGSAGDLFLSVRVLPHAAVRTARAGPAYAGARAGDDRRAGRRDCRAGPVRIHAAPEDSGNDHRGPRVPPARSRHAHRGETRRPRRPVRGGGHRDSVAGVTRGTHALRSAAGPRRRQKGRFVVNMNRYTEKAQEAVIGAQQLAERAGNPEVLPEHVLLALIAQRDGVVPAVLGKMQIDADALAT